MSENKHVGFETYIKTGEITNEFIKDFDYWVKRYFKQWSLFMELDEFKNRCWLALIEKLPEFNPNVATIQTFCISRIHNECWRIYMKNKATKTENDIDDPSVNCDIIAQESADVGYFNAFSEYAFNLGIKVNIQELYSDYIDGTETDAVKAFSWWMMKEKMK